MHYKHMLMLTCAIAAAGIANVAAAQTTPAADENMLEEIIVTAEKREQSLQDVPVAITAFTDERRELLGISNAQELTNFTPGLNYNTGNDRMTMRGIGRLTNNRASEGGVAMYSDGFYTSSVYAFSKSNLLVDRVEVLRGPQGTLYGRNSIGGAMNIISKRPRDEFEAEVRATFANYDSQTYEAAVGGPLFWGIKGRVAANYLDQGKGFYHNIAGGPSEGGRGTTYYYEGQLQGEITERFDWWVRGEKSKYDLLGRGAGGRQGVTWGVPNISNVVAAGATPSSAIANLFRTSPLASTVCDRCFESDTPNQIDIDSETFIGQFTFHADKFDVKYVTGRTWYHYELLTDVDGTANHTPVTLRPGQAGAPGTATGTGQILPTAGTTFFPKLENRYDEEPIWYSNEINIASTYDGPVQFLVGAYQFREESNYKPVDAREVDDARFETPLVASTGAPGIANPTRTYAVADTDTKSTSYAVFGQTDWQATDTLKVTAGLRYTWDKKTVVEGARLICFMNPSAACPAVFERTTGRPLDISALAVGTGTVNPATGAFFDSSQKTPVFTDPVTGLRTRVLQNSWEGWGGTLGADWQPTDDTLYYAKYTRGYKAGGFNAATTTLTPFVTTKKETIDAYEIGAKKTFARQLQVNASAFYYDYNDIQAVMQSFDTNLNANVSVYANLPKAEIKGFELEAIWSPIRNAQLNFTYAYLDSKVKEGCCYQDPEDPLALLPDAQPVTVGKSATQTLQDLKGQKLSGTTPHRIALNANYRFETDMGDIIPSVSYTWRDATYHSVFNRYYNKAKAYEQIDARLIFNDADKRYTVIAFIKNITDFHGQVTMSGSRLTNPGPNLNLVNQTVGLTQPRTYGLELQYRFR